ncbi:SDR family NAD(P)-dependent oxidoreductase [Rhizobium laguerreae]|nr:SDR family NAD(P)-dependent oxidoreductase [Rhizobium laguerreae]
MLRDQERIRSPGHHSPRSLRHRRVRTETAMSGLNLTMLPEAGSRVVVAGGCGGIGKILVKVCVDHRMDVTVLDTPLAIESAEAIEGVSYVAFDGRDPESIERAVYAVTARHDGLECLFFLSGFPIIPRRPLSEVPIDKWNELMSVNLTSAYLLVNGLSPLLKRGRDPAIVTVALEPRLPGNARHVGLRCLQGRAYLPDQGIRGRTGTHRPRQFRSAGSGRYRLPVRWYGAGRG